MDKKTLLTIIIPIYNQSEYIDSCMSELIEFHSEKYELQIILIDDGSTDNSGMLCKRYQKEYSYIEYYYQNQSGVSAARNHGISKAKGKYIFYLDSDDCLAPGTIDKVAEFFDSVYDETDLVTYPIETIYNGRTLDPHFRYMYLTESGVYDLNEYPYIGQTTMNIVVKNKFEDNILFDEQQTFSEDQKYCCEVLGDKLKMGFCKDGKYIYYRSSNSASGRLSGSCYIFEQCVGFFEQLFARYDRVPAAFQGLCVNDIYWKMASNILFPYHYEQEEYDRAIERIRELLRKCEDYVILEHPKIDFFEKYYLLRLKDMNTVHCEVNNEAYMLYNWDVLVLREESMEMVITGFRIKNGLVEIEGFLKTVFFQFYDKEPTLCVVENNGNMTRKLNLYPTAHNYYQSREKTQKFWAMRYTCKLSQVKNLRFEVEVGNHWFPVHYYFMPRVPFSHVHKRYVYEKDDICCTVNPDNSISFEPVPKGPVWLYYDCKGVACDNGKLQFQHDIEKKDGINRYYVVTDEKQVEDGSLPEESLVQFGSQEHCYLFLKSEKIITAFIEENNVIPFPAEEYDKYSGEFKFETIYLQHGVLHIKMPWKYTPERIMADKVVVSTKQEAALLCSNGFREEDLWKCKMPRFELLSPAEKKSKILFAPSWRSYLVGENKDNKWELLKEKFIVSAYYKQIMAFLNSSELHALLEENGYTLDVKLHPIFAEYKELYTFKSNRVRLIDEVEDSSTYSLFITDFSSYLYDFLYVGIPVVSFIPDMIEFKAGMNGYRDLNYSQEFWEAVQTEPQGMVDVIDSFFQGKKPFEFEADFYEGENIRENIYKKLML